MVHRKDNHFISNIDNLMYKENKRIRVGKLCYIKDRGNTRNPFQQHQTRMSTMLLLIAACLVVTTVNGESIAIGQYKKQLLDVHNAYRGMQGASDMQALVWDDQLSSEAANWIKRCQFEHEKKGRGENLAFDSNPKKDEELINSSMKAWYDEIKDYNYARKACGRSCHYTQIIWAQTRKVGCAIEKCNYLYAFGRSIKNAWYLACFYDPMGNNISEYPYTKGTACSQCLQEQSCENKLCTGEGVEVCEDLDEDCEYWSSAGECQKNPKFMLKKCRKACGVCKG